ncbi:MAG: carboxypeptidase regulatory-like domain-containing protein [Planctomycetes bacterium]|nr:carboxypeptidase regulatory-like domain-containing protein [Planctomycetota bacterium]
MNRTALISVLALLFAGLVGWFLFRGDAAPPPPIGGGGAGAEAPPAPEAAPAERTPDATPADAASQRTSVAVAAADPLLDPEIRAALTGFKGRVVDHQKQPVGDTGVRIYRGAMDTVLRPGLDLFAEASTWEPSYIAGETKTAVDGTFQIEGVWPRAFYLLFAGIGSDAPTHKILSHTPAPGEIIDLGDIELPDAAVLTGIVVDEDGSPLADALVRSADLPGQLAGFFPIERFDPKGALLIREPQSPVRVIEMPAWVEHAFEHLPIPSTRTAADGAFRLVGVAPGANLVATTKPDYLSDMKPTVHCKAGQVKDLGRIRLKRGEELSGRVLDTAGKPVVGAEVLAGSTLNVAPVDLATRVGVTDGEGRFRGQGFAPGKVTVAARRSKQDPWVLAEPQAILGDVLVTVPATFAITVSILAKDGGRPVEPRLRVLAGKAGDGAAEFAMLGFVPPIDLRERVTVLEDGRHRISGLAAGRYVVIADAKGLGMGHVSAHLETVDVEVQVELPTAVTLAVRVVGPGDHPIKSAAIYADSRGGERFTEMPMMCGRTDSEGRLTITQMQGPEVRVSADHPRWGVVHGRMKIGDPELVLRMVEPGAITGTVTENGQPVTAGKFTVGADKRGGDDGPIDTVPMLATPGMDGTFRYGGVQPGKYRLTAIKSLDALQSPGGVFTFAQDMMLMRNGPRVEVEVVSGQTATCTLEVTPQAPTGPTGHVYGTVQIDGRLAEGYMVSSWGEGSPLRARVDEHGRFDLGQVPVGDRYVSVMSGDQLSMFGGRSVWGKSIEVTAGEAIALDIVLEMTSLAGACYKPDGSPALNVHVEVRGEPFAVAAGNERRGNQGGYSEYIQTDANGEFKLPSVPAGIYTFRVNTHGDGQFRGELDKIEARAGQPVVGLRIDLKGTIEVAGRVDMAAFGQPKPEWAWIGFHEVKADAAQQRGFGDQVGGASVQDDGTFSTRDVPPGTWQVRAFASGGEQGWREFSIEGTITVPPTGVTDLYLRPVPRLEQPNVRRG